jgi:hypothetical protein
MHARTYVPMLGRFTRPDPNTKFSLFNPQSLNRYSYVANNPVKYVDPTGREAVLLGTDAEKSKTLQTLQDTLPVALRMFVRTTTNQQGQTVIDTRFLRMASGAQSGNFQALSTVASSEKSFRLSTSASTAPSTNGTVTLGRNSSDKGIFLDQGRLSPTSGASLVLVGGDLSRQEKALTLAHELRHASLFAEGRAYEHEMGMFQTAPNTYDAFDPNGTVNHSTVAAEREARVNFDPFYALR